jgi:hypothetical protein
VREGPRPGAQGSDSHLVLLEPSGAWKPQHLPHLLHAQPGEREWVIQTGTQARGTEQAKCRGFCPTSSLIGDLSKRTEQV